MNDKKQPNILLILTDQHRLSALGCYGNTPCKTPNIDRLAKEGVRFENAYTTCPVCTPARATIISGQYPHQHGMTSNCGYHTAAVWNIPDHPRMLPRRLIQQGYRCGYTGKWHMCPEENNRESFNLKVPHHVPSTLGFEGQDFMGHGGGGYRYREYQDYLERNKLELKLERNVNSAKNIWPNFGIQKGGKEATVDHFLANNTMALIDKFRAAEQPFFIWHNHWGPHEPYYPVEEFFAPYRNVSIPPWPNFESTAGFVNNQHQIKTHPDTRNLNWDLLQEAIRHYYAFTTQIDDQIGRILSHLEQTGALDDTIIVFTSDHGETLGSHGGMMDKGFSHFEEIQRVGMIVRYPEKYRPKDCAPGSVRSELASLIDMYPTFLELSGIPPDQLDAQGLSLHGLLDGRASSWREEVFVEFYGLYTGTTMFSCRSGDWKYGWNPNSVDELYNLADDPYETINLATDPTKRQICRNMLEKISNHLPESGIRQVLLDSLAKLNRVD